MPSDATSVEASFEGRGETLSVPLASDDQDALAMAAQLLRDARCEPVIVGNLTQGRAFERNGGFSRQRKPSNCVGSLGLTR